MYAQVRQFLLDTKDAVLQPYRNARMSFPVWFYILNRKAREAFAANPPQMNAVQKRVLADLKENGIAFTHLDELMPAGTLSKLQAYAEELRPLAEQVTNKKPFILEYWEGKPTLSLKNPFVAFALDPAVLDIVNGYMEMWSKFYYFMLGRSIPLGEAPQASQRWHRDFEEVRMCKVFIYLTDVGENNGPFIYVPKSHLGGKWRNVFPQRPGRGYYPIDGAVEKTIPPEDIKVCTAKAGTVIFADTSGLHKGGFVKEGERVMFTAGFSSSAAYGKPRYKLPPAHELAALSAASRFSLRGEPFPGE